MRDGEALTQSSQSGGGGVALVLMDREEEHRDEGSESSHRNTREKLT